MFFNCDRIVIFDLEATCWEGRENIHKYREVIALGACVLDLKTLEINGQFNIVCKPIKTEISEYCTKITGITKEQASNGKDFDEMCKLVLKELDTKSIPCAAWGADNEKMYSECRQKDCKYPFSNEYLNISLLYSIIMGKPYNNGLERSLAELGLKFVGEKHNPYWDSYNAAIIFKHIVEKCREII